MSSINQTHIDESEADVDAWVRHEKDEEEDNDDDESDDDESDDPEPISNKRRKTTPIPPTTPQVPNTTSEVWDHFTRIKNSDPPRSQVLI